MLSEEMKSQVKKDYFALCVAQKRTMREVKDDEKREIGFHYSEGLIDGFKECLKTLNAMTDEEISEMVREGLIVTILS